MKSDCLHECLGESRRPTLPPPPPSITENFGTQMSHRADPSSSSSRKPTKQKQNVKKIKKSVLSRQTVELLDKAALEYVHAQLLMFYTPPQCTDRSCFRSRRTTSRPSRIYQYRT